MIGSILVVGIVLTLATARLVKNKASSGDFIEITRFSNSIIPDTQTKNHIGATESFSRDMNAPQEASSFYEEPKQRNAGPQASQPAGTDLEIYVQPEEPKSPMKIGPGSEQAELVPQAPAITDENSIKDTVISPIREDPKNSPVNSIASSEGAAYYQKHLLELDTMIKKMREESVESTTYSMKGQADKELKMWIIEQNAIYSAIIEELSGEEVISLETSQQAWIKSRDAKAEEAAKKYSGGSLEVVEYTASMAESTRARAYDLVEEYISVLSLKEGQ